MSYILIFKQVLLGTPKEMHKEQKGENATRSNLDSMVVVQWLCDGVISSAGRKMDLPVFDKTVKYRQKGSFLYDGTSSVRVQVKNASNCSLQLHF